MHNDDLGFVFVLFWFDRPDCSGSPNPVRTWT